MFAAFGKGGYLDLAGVAPDSAMARVAVTSPSTLWHFGGLGTAQSLCVGRTIETLRRVEHDLRGIVTADDLSITAGIGLAAVGKVTKVVRTILLRGKLDF